MIQVPDPFWKVYPDEVADESFEAVYMMDDDPYSGLLTEDEQGDGDE